jgi:hypothetical protein
LTRTPNPGPGGPSFPTYSLLGKVHGAEKAFLSGRRDRDLELARPAKTPEEAVRLIRAGMRPA